MVMVKLIEFHMIYPGFKIYLPEASENKFY